MKNEEMFGSKQHFAIILFSFISFFVFVPGAFFFSFFFCGGGGGREGEGGGTILLTTQKMDKGDGGTKRPVNPFTSFSDTEEA